MWSQVGLRSMTMNKANGGDGIPVELFQILKDDAVKLLHSICQELWKTQQWPQDWKRWVFIPIPKKGNAKNAQSTAQLHSFHMLAKKCSKFSKPGFNSTWTMNFQMFKLDLEKAEEPDRDQIANMHWIIERAESFRKISTSALLAMPTPLTVWITTNCAKFWKRWEYQTTWPASWETCMQETSNR